MPAASRPISVQDLWSLALPAGTRLAAGKAGLDRVVEWVTSLRAAYPIFGALGPGYLALARLSLARDLDTRLTPSFLVQELHRAAAAALVVDEQPDDQAIDLANDSGLSLLVLPAGCDLYQIERDLLRALLDFHGQVSRREAEARERFQAVFARDGLAGVLDDLAQWISGAALLQTATGESLGEADRLELASEDLANEDLAGECEETRYPAQVGGRHLGELVVRTCKARRDPLDAVVARAAAEVCAVELLQRLTRREIEAELGVDLVEQLFGQPAEIDAACQRMERLGYIAHGPRDHLVLAMPGGRINLDRELPDPLRDIAWSARRDGAATLHVAYDDTLLLFVSCPAPLPARGAHRWVSEALARGGDRNSLGISRIGRGRADLGQAVRQALGALSLGQRISDRAGPHFYDDLGLYRVLADLRDRTELQRFYQETLGDLLAYDAEHGTELVQTLRVLFDENTNVSQTARALFVHRNTLNYRLQRIVEIAGIDLNDAETRLALQLALKVHQLTAS